MAEQDSPQSDKPKPGMARAAEPGAGAMVRAAEPAMVPARTADLPLSAAAAAAAAKMEATIAASRAAAASQQGASNPRLGVPKVPSLLEPVSEPVEHQLPAAVPVARNPAISAAAAAAASMAVSTKETPVKPQRQQPDRDRHENEDIIAQIPVEPLPGKAAAGAPAAAEGPVSHAAETQAVETPGAKSAAAAESAAAPVSQTASVVAEARNRVFGAYTPVPEPSPAARERRAAREAALGAKPLLARILQVVLAVGYPFVLLILAIRLIASPLFLWIAYQRPGFPADGFGFSTADRLTYGSYGVDYLNNPADSRYLGELRDALGNPLFLNTEVQHMLDVKNVISASYLGGTILAVLMLVGLVYLGRRYAGGIRRGLFAGSVATLGLFSVLTTLALLGWEAFFAGFHQVFFADGTWTFNYSDTLIRLYPPQFWTDAAIAIAVLVVATSLATLLSTWPTAKRREASRLRQEARIFGL